jgi:hypothetical protein
MLDKGMAKTAVDTLIPRMDPVAEEDGLPRAYFLIGIHPGEVEHDCKEKQNGKQPGHPAPQPYVGYGRLEHNAF